MALVCVFKLWVAPVHLFLTAVLAVVAVIAVLPVVGTVPFCTCSRVVTAVLLLPGCLCEA